MNAIKPGTARHAGIQFLRSAVFLTAFLALVASAAMAGYTHGVSGDDRGYWYREWNRIFFVDSKFVVHPVGGVFPELSKGGGQLFAIDDQRSWLVTEESAWLVDRSGRILRMIDAGRNATMPYACSAKNALWLGIYSDGYLVASRIDANGSESRFFTSIKVPQSGSMGFECNASDGTLVASSDQSIYQITPLGGIHLVYSATPKSIAAISATGDTIAAVMPGSGLRLIKTSGGSTLVHPFADSSSFNVFAQEGHFYLVAAISGKSSIWAMNDSGGVKKLADLPDTGIPLEPDGDRALSMSLSEPENSLFVFRDDTLTTIKVVNQNRYLNTIALDRNENVYVGGNIPGMLLSLTGQMTDSHTIPLPATARIRTMIQGELGDVFALAETDKSVTVIELLDGRVERTFSGLRDYGGSYTLASHAGKIYVRNRKLFTAIDEKTGSQVAHELSYLDDNTSELCVAGDFLETYANGSITTFSDDGTLRSKRTFPSGEIYFTCHGGYGVVRGWEGNTGSYRPVSSDNADAALLAFGPPFFPDEENAEWHLVGSRLFRIDGRDLYSQILWPPKTFDLPFAPICDNEVRTWWCIAYGRGTDSLWVIDEEGDGVYRLDASGSGKEFFFPLLGHGEPHRAGVAHRNHD